MASTRAFQIFRQFSTSAIRHKLVNPPIKVHGIDGSYAAALYSAASKGNKLDQVEKEMNAFKSLLERDAKLKEFLENPSLQRKVKHDALLKVIQKQKYSDLTTNLFTTLAENGRLTKTGSVLKAFAEIMNAHRGEIVVTVTTAQPLDASSVKDLKAALQGFAQKGQKMAVLLLQSRQSPHGGHS
jgi:F-type H+-transporting ATPase subunit O